MKGPIEYGLDLIFTQVPRELLERAFRPHPVYGFMNNYSLEALVRNEVINQRVLTDLNVIGGETVTIPLGRVPYTMVENAYFYQIPLAMTSGRHINAIRSVEFSGDAPNESFPSGGLESKMGQILGAHMPMESTGSARARIAGPNVVALTDYLPSTFLFLRCTLENDAQLQNLNPRYYRAFGKLCVWAAEMVVFNKLKIALGEGSQNGGQPNSYLRQALDEMQDARTLYNEELDNRWRKLSIMQDPDGNRRLVQIVMP